MDFTFTEDQLLFQDSVRDFLVNEVTPQRIRALWDTDSGRDDALWQQLAALGLTGLTVSEEFGGLGMNELDFVLLAQEAGYVALPEPLVQTAMVAVPLLSSIGGDLAAEWLPKVAAGEARVVVGLAQNRLVEDAHVAGLILLQRGGDLIAVTPDQVSLRHNDSVDPSRRLFMVDASKATAVAEGDRAALLVGAALNRGALACAAQALGLAQRMIDMSVQYTSERQQFGKPVGSFQAVKHHMANVAVRLEYAKAPTHRAAYAIANRQAIASQAVSHAKLVACEAANLAAKNSHQVHGAMGYTWEVDLHLFMKKAWALANSWGDAGFHKSRIGERIFADGADLGAGATFS
ncbi:MAG: acyl-CoA/acyl-ACP dehydrogenase [Halioglobus sp.]|nr:acyl-CoA/acyl-ACP dehydrogenase [Halioglobus sp.]